MTVCVLCLVALFFLGWVIALKSENSRLQKENDQMRIKLKVKLEQLTKDVKVAQGPSHWGPHGEVHGAQTAP